MENFFESTFGKYLRRDLEFFNWVVSTVDGPYTLKIIIRPIDMETDLR